MNRMPCLLALGLALAASGCSSLAPRTSVRLDEARVSVASLQGDADVARHASVQMRAAEETLQRAVEAADTLQDPALVDHLAYLARQRAAIARAEAVRAAAELYLMPPRARSASSPRAHATNSSYGIGRAMK